MSFSEIAQWLRIGPRASPEWPAANRHEPAAIATPVRIPPMCQADALAPPVPVEQTEADRKQTWLLHFTGELVVRLRPSTPRKAALAIAMRQWSELQHLPPREAAMVWHSTHQGTDLHGQ